MAYDGSLKFDTKIATDGMKSGIDKMKTIAVKGAKIIGASITAAAGTIAVIGKSAIQAYGDYEQLVGGVETLFKNNADTVMKYSKNAYETAGMSANEYMETVTGFSASMLQSLGGDTAKAAEASNQAVIDMADNANKMGTPIERIQDAYQGFAKQNYTMLDNLKLGYGGTQKEMLRLLEDAQKISGIQYDISSFADITSAIHVIQTEMGITGTTAKEASTTIQGSFNMLKGAWENLLTGLTDPTQNFDELINNLFESLTALGNNLMPRLETVLSGVANMISQLAPKIVSEIPGIVNALLPAITDGISQLLSTVMETITQLAPTLLTLIGNLAPVVSDIIMQLIDTIIGLLPLLAEVGATLIFELAKGFAENLPTLLLSAVDVIMGLIESFTSNVDKMIDVATDIILTLVDGLIDALPKIIEAAPKIIESLVSGCAKATPKIWKLAGQVIGKLAAGLVGCLPMLAESAVRIGVTIFNTINNYPQQMIDVGKNFVLGLWDGIKSKITWIKEKVTEWGKGILDKVKDVFGIHSPSKEFAKIGENNVLGLIKGTTKQEKAAIKAYKEAAKATKEAFEKEWANVETNFELGDITEAEKFGELERLRNKYFEKGTKEFVKYTKQINDFNEKALKERYQSEQKELKYRLDKGEITEKQYYSNIAVLRDKYFTETDEEYRSLTLDILNYEKSVIRNTYKEISEYATEHIEDVIKAQEKLESKLKSFGRLTNKVTFKGAGKNGNDITAYTLADLKAQTAEMQAFSAALTAVKQRASQYDGEMIADFLTALPDMSIDELNTFNRANDADFDAYMQAWFEQQQIAKSESTKYYADDMDTAVGKSIENAKKKLEEAGIEIPEDFFKCGTVSAEKFGAAFREEIDLQMKKVRDMITSFAASIAPQLSFAGAASAASVTTYNQNFVVGSSKSTVGEQISSWKNATALQRLRSI